MCTIKQAVCETHVALKKKSPVILFKHRKSMPICGGFKIPFRFKFANIRVVTSFRQKKKRQADKTTCGGLYRGTTWTRVLKTDGNGRGWKRNQPLDKKVKRIRTHGRGCIANSAAWNTFDIRPSHSSPSMIRWYYVHTYEYHRDLKMSND